MSPSWWTSTGACSGEVVLVHKVLVVGVGEDGLAGLALAARQTIASARFLVGTERLLAMIPPGAEERLTANPGAGETLRVIESNLARGPVVVLASGDPSFFGIGRFLVRNLGKERVEILPNVSSVQLAFARIKDSWEDATFLSVHGRSLEGIAQVIQKSRKVAILTDARNNPATIARELLVNGVRDYRAYLCENLGAEREKVTEASIEELAETDASPLNVLVLIRAEAGEAVGARPEWRHGIPDDEFQQRRPKCGLITKLEVRMVALGLLGLKENGVVWDVGAGSGSVAIEAALLAKDARVFAIERDPEAVELIRQNVDRFGATNVAVIEGFAPGALSNLPCPDSVFVGGSGGRLAGILESVAHRLHEDGRIVVSAASIETVHEASTVLRGQGMSPDLRSVQVSRSKDLAGLTHLESLNPVFLVTGRKNSTAIVEARN